MSNGTRRELDCLKLTAANNVELLVHSFTNVFGAQLPFSLSRHSHSDVCRASKLYISVDNKNQDVNVFLHLCFQAGSAPLFRLRSHPVLCLWGGDMLFRKLRSFSAAAPLSGPQSGWRLRVLLHHQWVSRTGKLNVTCTSTTNFCCHCKQKCKLCSKAVLLEQRVSWRGLSSRAGAVRPSPSTHGGHGGRLVRRRGRVGSSCRGSCMSQLADSPGGGHPASGPAAPLLVVSQKTTKPESPPGNF